MNRITSPLRLAKLVGRALVIAMERSLPTHRDLAFRLGVTIGTVSRAYAEAKQLIKASRDKAPATRNA